MGWKQGAPPKPGKWKVKLDQYPDRPVEIHWSLDSRAWLEAMFKARVLEHWQPDEPAVLGRHT